MRPHGQARQQEKQTKVPDNLMGTREALFYLLYQQSSETARRTARVDEICEPVPRKFLSEKIVTPMPRVPASFAKRKPKVQTILNEDNFIFSF